jgi:hypothetical protein
VSYFKNIFGGKTPGVFIWIVNASGEVAIVTSKQPVEIHSPEDMVVMERWERMIGYMLSAAGYVKPVVFTGKTTSTWDEVLETINGKRCSLQARMEGIHYALFELGISPLETAGWNGRRRRFALRKTTDSKK